MTRFSCLLSASFAFIAAASSLKRSLQPQGPTNLVGPDLLSRDTSYFGVDCWLNCGEQPGFCPWCGLGHACCSKSGDDEVPECAQTAYFSDNVSAEYQCVLPTNTPAFWVDSAYYGSVGLGSFKVDVTRQLNKLIAMNGVMDFTAGEDLNTLFGDPVRGVRKVLTVEKGQHLQEFHEGSGWPAYDLAPFMHKAMGTTPSFEQPSIFVAVLSRRRAGARRSLIRDMWSRAIGNSGNVTMKFALCRASDDLEYKLDAEHTMHGDIMRMHCKEAEDKEKLTVKVFMALKEFKTHKPARDFFMVVEDDTYVAWRRVSRYLTRHGSGKIYAGVPVEDSLPCRNPASKLYEPAETFPGDTYPATMSGGAGIILGRTLVDSIFREGVAPPNMLWNQERSVAVWVDKLVQKKLEVDYKTLPGLISRRSWNATSAEAITFWKDYPYFFHHGLHGVTISCLALAESSHNPYYKIHRCFDVEVSEDDAAEDEPVCWDR